MLLIVVVVDSGKENLKRRLSSMQKYNQCKNTPAHIVTMKMHKTCVFSLVVSLGRKESRSTGRRLRVGLNWGLLIQPSRRSVDSFSHLSLAASRSV